MTIHALRDRPTPQLARALAEFERRFTYPLGPGRSFRISHGEDYPRFFRAMGPATCFIAQRDHRLVGAMGVAIRPLLMPDGSQREVAYIGDLKVDPDARGTAAFLRLALTALAWARPQVDAAFGVVMDGTAALPASYSGRVGIPSFLAVGKISVIRFPTGRDQAAPADDRWTASRERGIECYQALCAGRYTAWGGAPAERSEMMPLWLVHPDGTACGRLEDTRRAKRLIDCNGTEMISAHLACFAWRDPRAGAELIHAARRRAATENRPALFVAVADQDVPALEDALGVGEKVFAPATVYGAGLLSGPAWNINTSEI